MIIDIPRNGPVHRRFVTVLMKEGAGEYLGKVLGLKRAKIE
jgi:hypothetical protein